MVQKDEMCAIFKTLRSVDRIEILCGMLQLCVPQELRFIGSCLEDLIQKNYKLLYDAECIANDSKQLKESTKSVNKIDRELCATLNIYLSLLHSDNASCAILMFSILNDLKTILESQVAPKDSPDHLTKDNELMEDIILIFTMASYHPAFSVTERLRMYEMCKSLKEILKRSTGQSNPKEFSSQCVDNIGAMEKPQSTPVEIKIKLLHRNKMEILQEVQIQVSWSDGSSTKCQRSANDIFQFHFKLANAFSNVGEVRRLNSCLSTPSGSEMLHSFDKYFQEFISLPKSVLKSEVVVNFLCNETFEGRVSSLLDGRRDPERKEVAEIRSNPDDSRHEAKMPDRPQIRSSAAKMSTTSRPLQSSPRLLQSQPLTCHSCKTSAPMSTSFYRPTRPSEGGRGRSSLRWSHSSDVKTKSVGSLANERSSDHRHRDQQHLSKDCTDPPLTRECSKETKAMKSCEEIDSHLLMTKLVVSPDEGNNPLLNNHDDLPHHDLHPGFGSVTGGGDQVTKRHSGCTKFSSPDEPRNLKIQNVSTEKNVAEDHLPSSASLYASPHFLTVDPNSTTAPFSGSKMPRPILGASANQNNHAAADDNLKVDPKPSNSVGGISLPRASSCGVILQQECDIMAGQEDNQIPPNLSSLQLPTNIAFNIDAFYNQNHDARINFLSLPSYPVFDRQCDSPHSQTLPSPTIHMNTLPPSHLNASILSSFPSPMPGDQGCGCCSSVASLPPFPNYPVWPLASQLFFRSNGLVGPRYPLPNMGPCASGVYMQPSFDYVQYTPSDVAIAPPSSVAIPSVPLTVSPLPHHQQFPPPPPPPPPPPGKNFCHNCGGSGHCADLCSEPFMLSLGQSTQFKLKTVPKTESADA